MSTAPEHTFRIALPDPDALHAIEQQAPDDLRAHFDLIKGGLETIPGVSGDALYEAVTLRALAHRPNVFRHVFLAEHYATKQGTVDRGLKELIATVVSERVEADETVACGPYHAGAATFEGVTPELLAATRGNWDEGSVPEEVAAALDLGVHAALAPTAVTDAHITRARAAGYTDDELVEIVLTGLVAYLLGAVNQTFGLREGAG